MGEKIVTRNGQDFVFNEDDPDDHVEAKLNEYFKSKDAPATPVINRGIPSVVRKTKIPVEDRMRAVAQAVGGVSDEALAFGRSLFGDEEYGPALEDERKRFKDAEDEYFWSTLAGQGAVGLGTGIAATKALQAAGGPRSRVIRGLSQFANAHPWKTAAAIGGVTAAPSGFASGEGGLGPRAVSGMAAVPFGATAGMAGATLPKMLKVGYDKIFPMLAGADNWASNKIASVLKDAPGMTPDRVAARLARDEAFGVPTMPMNASPALRDTAEELVTRGGPAGATVEAAVARQHAGQRGRVKDDVEWLIAPDRYHDSLGELRKDLKTNAATDFNKAYGRPPLAHPDLDELISHPFGEIGMNHARQLASNELPPRAMNLRMPVRDDKGVITQGGEYGTRELHDVRKAIDDILFGKSGGELVERFRNPVTGELTQEGRQLFAYRKTLDTKIGAMNPDYRKAVDTYADQAAIIKAQQQGRQAALNPAQMDQHTWEETIKELRGPIFGPSTKGGKAPRVPPTAEFMAFKQGAAQAMFDKYVQTISKKEGANWADFIRAPGTADRLRPLFDDQRSWLLFKAIMKREDEVHRQGARITGGSPTARRTAQMDAADQGVGMIERGVHASSGSPFGFARLMHGAMRLIPTSTTEQRKALARMLTSNNPAEVKEALDAVRVASDRLMRTEVNAGFNTMGTSGGLGIQAGDERPERSAR